MCPDTRPIGQMTPWRFHEISGMSRRASARHAGYPDARRCRGQGFTLTLTLDPRHLLVASAWKDQSRNARGVTTLTTRGET